MIIIRNWFLGRLRSRSCHEGHEFDLQGDEDHEVDIGGDEDHEVDVGSDEAHEVDVRRDVAHEVDGRGDEVHEVDGREVRFRFHLRKFDELWSQIFYFQD